jgi:1,4-alpha-glucan branching enzyme
LNVVIVHKEFSSFFSFFVVIPGAKKVRLQGGDTVDFNVKMPRPRRHVNKDSGWRIFWEEAGVDLVYGLEFIDLRAIDIALEDFVE